MTKPISIIIKSIFKTVLSVKLTCFKCDDYGERANGYKVRVNKLQDI